MLLGNRRLALLHFLLAAMQAAWIAAFFLLAWAERLGTGPAYAAALVGLVGWMLALELLSRGVNSPLYDLVALGGLVLISLLLVRLVLYPGGPPWQLSWIGRALGEAANWKGGLPPLAVLIGLNVLLWQRAPRPPPRAT